MMPLEDPLAQAEFHLREGKERASSQVAVIEQMGRDHRPLEAAQARAVLMAIQGSVDVTRRHLEFEQQRKARP